MAFLCQYILNINCLWKFLSKIVLFIAYLGFLLSQTVSIPIFGSRTEFATLTPCCVVLWVVWLYCVVCCVLYECTVLCCVLYECVRTCDADPVMDGALGTSQPPPTHPVLACRTCYHCYPSTPILKIASPTPHQPPTPRHSNTVFLVSFPLPVCYKIHLPPRCLVWV